MGFTDAVSLHGREISLLPLSHAHRADLIEALNDGELWALWYTSIPAPDQLDGEISRRLALHQQGTMVPFSVIEKSSNQAVGMTTFLNIDAANRRLEIGATWYRKRVQRTAVNSEAKFLLLSYAFEQLKCIAVEFRTHFFNQPSRAGIERLGAKLDGVLRQHQLARNGALRDTCVYSIVDREWPTVKTHLAYQLGKPR
jgi:RimJ/RimL family protein N-acetyltransferase